MSQERELVSSGFKLVVTKAFLRLSRNGKGCVEVSPAEVTNLTKFLSIAKSLVGNKVLPPHITSTPFRIFFGEGKEDTSLTLFKRGGKRADMVSFDFGTIDPLIILLNQGVASWKDSQILMNDPKSRPPTPAWTVPEPTFDGLN